MLKEESNLFNLNIKFRTEGIIIWKLDSVKRAIKAGCRLANKIFNDPTED